LRFRISRTEQPRFERRVSREAAFAQLLIVNGELRNVSINDEKMLLWGSIDISKRAPRICAVRSRKYHRGSAEGNPGCACQSRNGDYHLSEIQRAGSELSFEVV
jgi:hypothetical protein